MFIYRRENALSSELCKSFIDVFEASEEKRPGVLYGPDGSSSAGDKKSTDITFNPSYLEHETWSPLLNQLIPVLQKGQSDYIDRHSLAFSKLDPFDISPLFNMQRLPLTFMVQEQA